jgi:two-component system sensor kinase FixL
LPKHPDKPTASKVSESPHRAQAIAEEEVESFRAALGPFVVAAQATRMAIVFTNARGSGHPIIFANDSFLSLVGYDREEVLSRDFGFLLSGTSDPGAEARIEAGFKCDAEGPVEVGCRRKDGRTFPAAVYISPVRDECGVVVQHFLSFVDLTAFVEHKLSLERILSLQAELIHLARSSVMGTMATTLAHELNQPLTAISNYTASCRLLLASGAPDALALAQDLAAIEQSTLRAGAVISRLREMTRRGPTKREAFDLNEAVRDSVELVRAGSCDDVSIESKGDGVLMIEADRVQIQQVIINLARNGCEAAAERRNGRVTVTAELDGDRALLSVDDTGLGVTQAASASLFEWADSAKPDGMGVGLSISRSIVEAHEGNIWLDEELSGHTRFCVSLPLSSY